MDQEMKARWVARLRSGKDKQGKNNLRNDKDEMCCLGVLAEEMGVPCKFESWGQYITTMDKGGCWVYEFPQEGMDRPHYSGKVLPTGYLGITGYQVGALIRMNDVQGKTFSEIADWIEENL